MGKSWLPKLPGMTNQDIINQATKLQPNSDFK